MRAVSLTGVIAASLVVLTAPGTSAQVRRVAADVTATGDTDVVRPGSAVRLGLTVRVPDGLHVQSDRPRDPALIPTTVTIDPPAGVTVGEKVFPAARDLRQRGVSEPLAVFDGQFTIEIQLVLDDGVAAGELVIPAHLRYQACDEVMCYPPSTTDVQWTLRIAPSDTSLPPRVDHEPAGPISGSTFGTPEASGPTQAVRSPDDPVTQLAAFAMLGTTGGYVESGAFLTFLRNAEQGVQPANWFAGKGLLAMLLMVFVGGLALNLTPCVLPMIPINLAIIGAGSQATSPRRGLLLGATYGAAMAVVYGVLGLVVILTAGTFGTLNASVWFNLGISAIFVVLGLAMFDRLTIDFSRWSSRYSPGNSRGSFALAFTMGSVAALLAGACVAPVVIQVVLFSTTLYASGSTSALALPFVLGLGMAAPWPAAGAGLASLPKPGAWMVRVKQVFGVFILGTATYYGYVGYGLMADRWVDGGAVSSSVDEKIAAGWHASLSEGLQTATRTGRPVLIDLWATWCKNCLVMDRTTFADPEVMAALSGYVKVKFQAEQPDEEPARSVMQRFAAVGLPTYVVLRPIPKTVTRGTPSAAGIHQ